MNKNNIVLVVAFCLLKSVAINATANESITPFAAFTGAPSQLSAQSIPILAEYKLLIMGRGLHHKVGGDTWGAIKALSPDTQIFLYQSGPYVADNRDTTSVAGLNNLGRYNVSRGSSDGSINKDHPEWFLKNSDGQRINLKSFPNSFALDFGNQDFAAYWSKHTLEDIAFQKWAADGIFIDDAALCSSNFVDREPASVPVKYPDCQSWNNSLSDFLVQVSGVLQQNNQKVMANIGNTHQEAGVSEVWKALDQRSTAPNIFVEEGAFVVSWNKGVVMHWPVKRWQQQIDLPSRINRPIAMISSTDLAPGQNGVSAKGEAVSHSQVMRFAAGSYLLARSASGSTTYFRFADAKDSATGSNKIKSAKRYEQFDVGTPVAKYEKKSSDQDLFYRKYTGGYVYVNPGKETITAIKADSDAEFSSDYNNARQEGSGWVFDLPPHDAAILRVREGGVDASKQQQAAPPEPPVLQTN